MNSRLRALGALWPLPVQAGEDLDRALAVLDAPVGGGAVLRWSYGATLVLAGLAGALAVGRPRASVLSGTVLLLALVPLVAGPTLPRLAARAKRTRALGAAPALLTRATVAMRISPSPERAARFAARTGSGPLAESLGDAVDRRIGQPGSGFSRFAAEWASWLPELERASDLVESAAGEGPDRRTETLDTARRVVLDGASERMADFAGEVRGPATALYAFGVVLPLALVSLVPAVRAVGFAVPVGVVVLVFDLALPGVLLGASVWLVARRPIAFPPTTVTDHPSVPSRPLRGGASGIAVGGLAGLGAAVLLPTWTVPLAGVGFGVGTALLVHYRPAVAVRRSVRDVERGLSGVLARVGSRVERGESVESAIERVATEVSTPAGDLFAIASRRQRRLGTDLETAFFGPGGPLSTVPSDRVRDGATLLVVAAGEGRPAGEALGAMASHLDELATLEREGRRSVAHVTGTLSSTGAVFGPLVGGTTVALAGSTGSVGPLAGGATPRLAVPVGVYVLLLSVILTALGTALARGFDRSLVGYRVGTNLLVATGTVIASSLATTALV